MTNYRGIITDWKILCLIATLEKTTHRPPSLVEISKIFQADKSNVWKLIKRLQDEGFIGEYANGGYTVCLNIVEKVIRERADLREKDEKEIYVFRCDKCGRDVV